jgi:biopolymer transport protein ExbB
MMEKVINAEAAEKITKLENGFDILTAMGSLSPLTGFLGTVSGMISAFSAIAKATDVNAQLVAGGIFEALITTVFGLVIAVIAISGYSVLAHIVDKFANDIESLSTDVITTIIMNNENAERSETVVGEAFSFI